MLELQLLARLNREEETNNERKKPKRRPSGENLCFGVCMVVSFVGCFLTSTVVLFCDFVVFDTDPMPVSARASQERPAKRNLKRVWMRERQHGKEMLCFQTSRSSRHAPKVWG